MRQGAGRLLGAAFFTAAMMMVAPLPALAENKVVKTGGAGLGLGVIKELAKAFEQRHPDITIKIVPSLGSAGGIKALAQGALDIAISVRGLNKGEVATGAVAREVARSPFLFIVNKQVTKEGITTRELESIFSGQTIAWPDGKRVRLVLRPETDTFTRMVRGLSPAMDQAVTLAMSREGMNRAITDQASADMVEKISNALGTSSLTQVCSEKRQVKILAYNGVRPEVKGAANESYRLFLPIYLVTSSHCPPAAASFMEFILSDEGRAILARYGNLAAKDKESVPQ